MKKILTLLLVIVMCLSFVACGGEKDVVSGFDGKPALNWDSVGKHIERVELTVDNWKEYIKEYSYEVELVEKDAFGEITNSEKVTVYRLGYGTEKYHSLQATIELQHKQTGEIRVFGVNGDIPVANQDICAVSREPFHLEEYECTRISGYLYFVDYPEEVMEEVLSVHDRENYSEPNATIIVSGGMAQILWDVDVDAMVIDSNWSNYFE